MVLIPCRRVETYLFFIVFRWWPCSVDVLCGNLRDEVAGLLLLVWMNGQQQQQWPTPPSPTPLIPLLLPGATAPPPHPATTALPWMAGRRGREGFPMNGRCCCPSLIHPVITQPPPSFIHSLYTGAEGYPPYPGTPHARLSTFVTAGHGTAWYTYYHWVKITMIRGHAARHIS